MDVEEDEKDESAKDQDTMKCPNCGRVMQKVGKVMKCEACGHELPLQNGKHTM